jgi:hypothetical protein
VSSTNPTATIVNGLTVGTTLKTTGKNIFTGSNYSSEFNTGTNEDTYILAGKPTGNVIINNNNNNTIIGSAFSKVGIANTNPQTTLDVYGDVKVGGNVGYGNSIYSDNTYSSLTSGLGLNIIPLGVIRYRSRRQPNFLPGQNGPFFDSVINVVGNLGVDMFVTNSNNVVRGTLLLNNTITSQYATVIAVGQPGYNNIGNTLNYYLMGIHSIIKDNITYNSTLYNKSYYWEVETDGGTPPNQEIYGTVIIYGIK